MANTGNTVVGHVGFSKSSTYVKYAVDATQLLHAHDEDSKEGASAYVGRKDIEKLAFILAILG